jgi:hypothetical protein
MSTTSLRTLGRSYLQQLANENLRQWVMNLWLTTNDEEEAVAVSWSQPTVTHPRFSPTLYTP